MDDQTPGMKQEESKKGPSGGIIRHLIYIGEELSRISREETDPARKESFFEGIGEDLQRIEFEINSMMEKLTSEEIPQRVKEIVAEIDQNFIDVSNFFLDAIEFYYYYIESEDPNSIEQALRYIKEGKHKLEQADTLVQKLDEYDDSSSVV